MAYRGREIAGNSAEKKYGGMMNERRTINEHIKTGGGVVGTREPGFKTGVRRRGLWENAGKLSGL
jgi:hypothetical protein